jgi:thimet oligopeptidase
VRPINWKRGIRHRLAALLSIAAVAMVSFGAATATAAAAVAGPARFFTGSPDAAAFRALCDADMKGAKETLDKLVAVKGKRTEANTLRVYNDLVIHAYNVAYPAGLMESTHPDSAYRAAAEKITQEVDKFLTDLSLNRAVYDAIVAVDPKGLDPETRYFREKTLRDFRRAGVDRDDATRKKISELNEHLTLLSQQFGRNIREDRFGVSSPLWDVVFGTLPKNRK